MAVRILYNIDTWDAATITSSSEASSDLAGDNVAQKNPARPWRTTSEQSQWIKFDLGAAAQITCFSMFNFNLSASAEVKLQAHTSDAWGSPDYDPGALTIATDDDGVVFQRLVVFLDQTYRWWRVTIDDYPNSDGYVQIGRIAAGAYYEPSRTYSEQFGIRFIDPSEGREIPGAWSPKRSRTKFRQATVGFEFMAETQRDEFETMFRKIGNDQPIVVALDPTDRPSKDSLYCTLATDMDLVNRFVEQYDAASLVFEEKVR